MSIIIRCLRPTRVDELNCLRKSERSGNLEEKTTDLSVSTCNTRSMKEESKKYRKDMRSKWKRITYTIEAVCDTYDVN